MQSPSSVKGPWEREWVRLLPFSLLETTEYKSGSTKGFQRPILRWNSFLFGISNFKHEKTKEKRTMISAKANFNPRPFMFIAKTLYYNLSLLKRYFMEPTFLVPSDLSITNSQTHSQLGHKLITKLFLYISRSLAIFLAPPGPSQTISGSLSQFSTRWSLIFLCAFCLKGPVKLQ